MTDVPPLHPLERERLRHESTLVVTVSSAKESRDTVQSALGALDRGENQGAVPTIAFTSYDDLLGTLTPRVLELLEAIRREEPSSINETARVVDRDVKNVYEELSRLARLGIVYFEPEGRSKRPLVWFDELVIDLPLDSDDLETAPAAP